MTVRHAANEDMDAIYMMGFDVWGDGDSLDLYLQGCRSSAKYKRGQWFLLIDDQGARVSSLITYQLSDGFAGIGSIATPKHLRGRGFASRLIQETLRNLSMEGFETVFLFADIASEFYEKFGFKRLPEQFQIKKNSVCMVYGQSVEELIKKSDFSVPAYF